MDFTENHLKETVRIAETIDHSAIRDVVGILSEVRKHSGRIFFLGVGGSAANCSHAVNDFRKIAGFEAYTPADNISELTARINDEGMGTSFSEWLKGSRLRKEDCIFVMSVGGGNLERNVSPNIVNAINLAKDVGARIVGIVGRDGGHTSKKADACVIVPVVNPESVTPHTEAFQGVVWHLIVSHPDLKVSRTKWESENATVGKP